MEKNNTREILLVIFAVTFVFFITRIIERKETAELMNNKIVSEILFSDKEKNTNSIADWQKEFKDLKGRLEEEKVLDTIRE